MRNIAQQRPESRFRPIALASAGVALLVASVACGDAATHAQSAPDEEGAPPGELALDARAILDAHLAQQEFPGAVMALHDPVLGDALVTSGKTRPGNEGSAVDPDVPWVIGSATKMFVAVVVLQLAEEGRLDLDASIEPYFPTLPRASEITGRELLQHTSGLNEYFDAPAVLADAERPWTPREMIDVAVARGAVGEPGGAHHYANTNYILLGELIAEVGGAPWYEAVRQRILAPLGMQHTHYSGEPQAPRMGPGYGIENGTFVEYTTRVDPSLGGAAGALQSTAPDLMRFARALLDGSLLDAQRQAEMRTFVPGEPRGPVDHEYGLGFEKYLIDEVTLEGHAGSAPAHASFVGFDPDSGLVVTVLINSAEPAPAPTMALEAVGAVTGKPVNLAPPEADAPPATARK